MADRKPVYYPYIRVSSKLQVLKGKSLEEQEEQLTRHFAYIAAEAGDKAPIWGGVYKDAGVSAGKTPFRKRAAGAALAERLRPGDHVSIVSLDRGFRNFKDAVENIEAWIALGVIVHVLDFKLSTDSLVGTMVLRILAVCAQFQRDKCRERIMEVKAMMRGQGLLLYEAHAQGWRYVKGKNGQRGRPVPDEAERQTIRSIARMKDEDGLSFHDITVKLLENRIFTKVKRTAQGEQARSFRAKGEWSLSAVKKAYYSYKENPTFRNFRLEQMLGLNDDGAAPVAAPSGSAVATE